MTRHWLLIHLAKARQADLYREAKFARQGQDLKPKNQLSTLAKRLRSFRIS